NCQHRLDQAQISDVAGANLAVNHHAAGSNEVDHGGGFQRGSVRPGAAFSSACPGGSLPRTRPCGVGGTSCWRAQPMSCIGWALTTATWRSGYATVCKTVYPGSIPGVASKTDPIFHSEKPRPTCPNARRAAARRASVPEKR